MESDDLDEVDWEFLGGDTTQTETNYFGKGNTTTYDRAIYYPVSSPQTTQHSYAVNWTSSSIEWLIDGVVVRTLNYADANGGSNFPQTPMRLKVGIWAGGDPSNGQGTIEWAGGLTNFGDAPFTMTVQAINIVNYSPGSSYTFSDESGSWQSIKVTGGSGISGSGSGSGSSDSGSSSGAIAATSTTLSGSAAVHVSTASSISTSTAGASTASSVPPVILQSTISANTANTTHAVTSTGVLANTSSTNNTTLISLPSSQPATNATNATNGTYIGTTLANTTRTTSASLTLSTSSGADNLHSKMSFAALFGFGLFAAFL